MFNRMMMIMVLLFSIPGCTLSSTEKGCSANEGVAGADAGTEQPNAQKTQTPQAGSRLIERPDHLVTKTLLPQLKQAISREALSWSRQSWKNIVQTKAAGGSCLAAQLKGQVSEGC